MNIIVSGSYGELTVDWSTGNVLAYVPADRSDPAYADIARFDVAEYQRTYSHENRPTHVDIIDLGYWTVDRHYVEPDAFHREMVAKNQGCIRVNASVVEMLTRFRDGTPPLIRS